MRRPSVVVAVQPVNVAEPSAVRSTVRRPKRDLPLPGDPHLGLEETVLFVLFVVVLVTETDSRLHGAGLTPASAREQKQ
ncbi:hypothetical protein JTE90_003526 [Oedothorax gibbosus]|uniref:Uncharacterized protein n=1 Tax=Oedothorax gibbosus TaxID=931172 RepID=A0AAV6UQQ8_9ARAC|nr:hypothetical protein JTE90_003526 [Oedothorax gibbosus]